MKPALVFCHGINVGAAERAGIPAWLEARTMEHGVRDTFRSVTVAAWASSGFFMEDLAALGAHSAVRKAAVQSVWRHLVATLREGPALVVAHSMGAPLAVTALTWVAEKAPRCSLLTVGGPLGNPWARAYLNWVPPSAWHGPPAQLGLVEWLDVWSPEDPICGGAPFPGGPELYRAFPAADPVRMDCPGHPNPLMPLAEHSEYFKVRRFWLLAKFLAERL